MNDKKIHARFYGIQVKNGYWISGDGCISDDNHTYILVSNIFGEYTNIEIKPETLEVRLLKCLGKRSGLPVYDQVRKWGKIEHERNKAEVSR